MNTGHGAQNVQFSNRKNFVYQNLLKTELLKVRNQQRIQIKEQRKKMQLFKISILLFFLLS